MRVEPSHQAGPIATPGPPDDAAALIDKCGKPDLETDKQNPPGDLAQRAFLYRKAGVKVIFARPPDGSERGWRAVAIVDAKTGKPIPVRTLPQRMPCMIGKPKV
jgi:hypothetical protein